MNLVRSGILLPIIIFLFSIVSGFVIHADVISIVPQETHFVKLAEAFIKNDLYLNPLGLPGSDIAAYKGLRFVFYGPLPSIIMIPFVFIFGPNLNQTLISLASLTVIFVLTFLITRKFVTDKDSIYLSIFFVFGTVVYFLGLVPLSAYLVQIIGLAFVLASLHAYFNKSNALLIGALVALAGMTRVVYFGVVIFFILEFLRNKLGLNKILLLLVPILLSLTIIGVYNFRRFGSVFETGYKYNQTLNLYPMEANFARGILSIEHLPTNLYFLLFKSPDPVKYEDGGFNVTFPFFKADGWGMAIWFTSPLFLYLLKAKKSKYTISALITVVVLALPSLFYFGIGFSQYGYRYQLDFLPFLFLLLLPAFGEGLPRFAKFLIVCGVLFNCLYMLSIWDRYPLFRLFGLE